MKKQYLIVLCLMICSYAFSTDIPTHTWNALGFGGGTFEIKCPGLNEALSELGYTELPKKLKVGGLTWMQVGNENRFIGLNTYGKKMKGGLRYSYGDLRGGYFTGQTEFFYGIFVTIGGFRLSVPKSDSEETSKESTLKAHGWMLNIGLNGYTISNNMLVGLNVGTMIPLSFKWKNNETLPKPKSIGYGVIHFLYSGDIGPVSDID